MAKRESKCGLYKVQFDTQKYRHYITWNFITRAHNQQEAKDRAWEMWNSNDNIHYPECKTKYGSPDRPHMFHMEAHRIPDEELDHRLEAFYIINDKYVTWGYPQKLRVPLWY